MIIPYEKLSPEALKGLIEEFVTREGTDSGYTEKSLEDNVEMVKKQLRHGEAVVVYDEASQTANIVHKTILAKGQEAS
ncbi:MAG TPA: YheU family protein [Thermodesulfobacteriota bacterium]|nr:YheU family protein [Thermodesulfobacteriota bacterium]